jgi:hypothetical protein
LNEAFEIPFSDIPQRPLNLTGDQGNPYHMSAIFFSDPHGRAANSTTRIQNAIMRLQIRAFCQFFVHLNEGLRVSPGVLVPVAKVDRSIVWTHPKHSIIEPSLIIVRTDIIYMSGGRFRQSDLPFQSRLDEWVRSPARFISISAEPFWDPGNPSRLH